MDLIPVIPELAFDGTGYWRLMGRSGVENFLLLIIKIIATLHMEYFLCPGEDAAINILPAPRWLLLCLSEWTGTKRFATVAEFGANDRTTLLTQLTERSIRH